jgi:WD40 repeat protein
MAVRLRACLVGLALVLWGPSAVSAQERFLFKSGGQVKALAFTPNGKSLVCTSGMNLVLWDVPRGRPRAVLGGKGLVWSLAVSPDGKMVATGDGSAVRLWSLASGRQLAAWETSGPSRVAISPDGKLLAATDLRVEGGAAKGIIRLWEIKTKKELPPLAAHGKSVSCLAFVPPRSAKGKADDPLDVDLLAVEKQSAKAKGKGDRPSEREAIEKKKGRKDPAPKEAKSNRLASAADDGTIKVWDVGAGKVLATFNGHAGPLPLVMHLAVSSDGRHMASVCIHDKAATIWDLAEEEEPVKTGEHGGAAGVFPLGALAFSPDGKLLITAERNTIKFWDVAAAKEKATVKLHVVPYGLVNVVADPRLISALAFAPNGRWVAVGCQSGVVVLLDVRKALAAGKGD